MPQPFWRHTCTAGDRLLPLPGCPSCAGESVFEGWQLTTFEAMSVHTFIYNLKPTGAHRAFADRLFAPMRNRCVRCRGGAILSYDDTWHLCPVCEGTGGVWNRSETEIVAAWREVVARWPDAAVSPVQTERPAEQRKVEFPSPQGDKLGDARRPNAWRRKGVSSHGIRFDEVERAFAEAERVPGTQWRLRGRGHCRRVALDRRYSRHARRGAPRSWAAVTPRGSGSKRCLMPLAIVTRAARLVGVPARLFISQEF